jgi:TonB family protein
VRLLAALLLSLLANVLIVWIALLTGAFRVGTPAHITPVGMTALSPSEWEHNRSAAPAPRPPPARPPPQPPPPPQRGGTIVELPPVVPGARNEPPPDDAKFLAERNQHVDKETVSKFARGHAGPVLPVPQQASPGKQASGSGKPEQKQEKLALAKPRTGDGPGLSRAVGEGTEDVERRASEGSSGPDGGPPGPHRPDLSVGPESLARIAGAPNMDGFGQAEEGDVTALNTREFKYATYMNQIRRRIGEAWYPKIDDAMRARDPEGKSFFYKQRTVTVGITLDLAGRVTDLSVIQSSNIDFFDRIAVAAVRQAEPFLNPPPGMFEHDGVARIPFSFTVYPSDRRGSLFWRPPVGE